MSQPRAYNLYAQLATGQTEYCGTIFAATIANAQTELQERLEQGAKQIRETIDVGVVAPGKNVAAIQVSELLTYVLIDAAAEAAVTQLHRKLVAALTSDD